MTIPRINGDRLWADLMALGEIGYAEGRGVTRTALSETDLAGKAWLVRRFEEVGLTVTTGMIFVPCRRGMSHSPEEWIEPAQAAHGGQVLLRTLLGLTARA